MEHKIFDIYINPYYFRIKKPLKNSFTQVYCLIHGWSGNEKSMSIFSSVIPDDSVFIFPRGPLQLGDNEYAWVDIRNNKKPTFEDYSIISLELIKSIQELIQSINLYPEYEKINLIGFSQGAAICAVLSILYPDKFHKVALLSGFLPANPPTLKPEALSSIYYYIAHGTQDKLVEFEKALKLKNYLEKYNSIIKFCQEDLGHKIGASCLKNLNLFFKT
ncbi:MAG: alpha/beta fold hydrolase [Anaerolineaceae bacterium]|nr:alpha/beta fold hydrolase [Anaerolineaceae bacterium]